MSALTSRRSKPREVLRRRALLRGPLPSPPLRDQRPVHRGTDIGEREGLGDHVVDQRVEAVRALALVGVAGHQQDDELGEVARGGERERDAALSGCRLAPHNVSSHPLFFCLS